MGMMEHEIGEDDEDSLFAVASEFVVAVHGRGVGQRVIGRRERPVLGHIAAEDLIARRTCNANGE